MDNPENDELRQHEFDSQNYNPFIDGADFIRVVLRFLTEHPRLRSNRVVIVPESYGGIRTIVMLHLLLYYQSYGDGQSVFQSPDLVREIQNHYNSVFPAYRDQRVPPAIIAEQFSHQIHIQTAVSWPFQRHVGAWMLEQPGSRIHQLAEETGVPYTAWRDVPGHTWSPSNRDIMNHIYDYLDRINRDPYNCDKPANFFLDFLDEASELLTTYASLNRIIGMDAAAIPQLFASARERAYKSREPNASSELLSRLNDPILEQRILHNMEEPKTDGNLVSVFGGLEPWDRYFYDLNPDVSTAFSYNRTTFYEYFIHFGETDLYGRMFLDTVAWVHTFITNASHDIVVYNPALPEALAAHTDKLMGVFYDREEPQGSARPGRILLAYRPSSVPDSAVAQRSIRFPNYLKSGHAVPLTEPAEMLSDVQLWLESTGAAEINNQGGKK
jgi:hypothetical protein